MFWVSLHKSRTPKVEGHTASLSPEFVVFLVPKYGQSEVQTEPRKLAVQLVANVYQHLEIDGLTKP